jgi:hypothetical protein
MQTEAWSKVQTFELACADGVETGIAVGIVVRTGKLLLSGPLD